ncbi:MAG: hypothetical protein ABR529_08980 [Actinomycetota bacterium]
MLRLMGLPHVARWPRAAVTRDGGVFSIVFSGTDPERRVDVPLAELAPDQDLETAELRLLASLQELGYSVERCRPPEKR